MQQHSKTCFAALLVIAVTCLVVVAVVSANSSPHLPRREYVEHSQLRQHLDYIKQLPEEKKMLLRSYVADLVSNGVSGDGRLHSGHERLDIGTIIGPMWEQIKPLIVFFVFTAIDNAKLSGACRDDALAFIGDIGLFCISPPECAQTMDDRKWIFKVLDALGKPNAGLSRGNLYVMGSREVCSDTVRYFPGTNVSHSTFHYCISDIAVSGLEGLGLFDGLPASIQPTLYLSICAGDSCSGEELDRILSGLLLGVSGLTDFGFNVTNGRCDDDPMDYTMSQISYMTVAGVLLLLVIASGIYQILRGYGNNNEDHDDDAGINKVKAETAQIQHYHPENRLSTKSGAIAQQSEQIELDDSSPIYTLPTASQYRKPPSTPRHFDALRTGLGYVEQLVLCFSPFNNCHNITATSEGMEDSEHRRLSFLHGMRTLSMWWILLAQTYYYMIGFAGNILDLLEIQLKSFGYQTVLNAGFAIDTFLFISGFLLTYKLIRRLQSSSMSVKDWILLYTHRLWRLTPAYMFVLFFFTTMILHVLSSGTSGSFWLLRRNTLEHVMGQCEQNWWTNLVYISNFYPQYVDDGCMTWTWFLALSMQLFVISPLIIYIAHRWRKLGIAIIALLVAGCTVAIGVLTWQYKLPVWNYQRQMNPDLVVADNEPGVDYYDHKPYTRGLAYFVGMLLAVLVTGNKYPSMKVSMNRAFVGLTTILVVFVQGVLVYVLYRYAENPDTYPLTTTETAVYHSLSALTWSACLAWIAFICITGNGGLINNFLSWPWWRMFSRLSYGVYLVHPIIIINYFGNLQNSIYLSPWNLMYIYFGHICVCYGAALIVAVLVEYPTRALEVWAFKLKL